MRVVLSADMEAIAQITELREILACCPEYWATGRPRMTEDVAAAASGLLDAGADEVVVLDNHGSGNAENVIGDELPDGARLETWDVFDLPEHGVDAMLQVGYHARAGVECFVPHTYLPELRLRVDGEPISETHGRTWAADVPLVGIVGNSAHERTLGAFAGTPFLVVQDADEVDTGLPRYADREESADAIRAFAAQALRDLADAPRHTPPTDLRFEAALDRPLESDAGETMATVGWTQTGTTKFALDLDSWADARVPLQVAMAASAPRMAATLAGLDLSSPGALRTQDPERVTALYRYADAWLGAMKDERRADWPPE